jgi:hypothetical protein
VFLMETRVVADEMEEKKQGVVQEKEQEENED